MKKQILTFGAIGGVLVTVLMLSSASLFWNKSESPDFELGETLGYLSMIVSLSVIFFGIKSYRENHTDGKISFGKAFKVGLLITLVASAIYVASWMVYYSVSEQAQRFPELYKMHQLEKLEAANTAREEIEEQMADLEAMFEIYENPVARAGITLMEIFPVGLVITLLSSFLLKTKPQTA